MGKAQGVKYAGEGAGEGGGEDEKELDDEEL